MALSKKISAMLFLQILFFCTFAHTYGYAAQDTNAAAKKEKELLAYQEKLRLEEEKKKELSSKISEINKDLKDTKNSLIDIAQSIQNAEMKMNDLDKRIEDLETKKLDIEEKLKKDKASTARLLIALSRIKRTPPEAMIARPETPYKIAQSALLMGNIIPSIQRHAKALKNNLETLTSVTKELSKDREESAQVMAKLKTRYEEVSALMDKRNNLYESIHQDIKAKESSIYKISLQAKNLEDLVQKLKDDARREEERQKEKLALQNENSQIHPENEEYADTESFKGKDGSVMPISGLILTRYRQKDDLGAISNGLTIQARSSALVVAPKEGKISFAGSFKRYGNIIIIEHKKGLHSLVAGLEKIDTVVGQHVQAGEPIGKMPPALGTTTKPKLYYELRKNGDPVNPSLIFPDLS